MFSIASVKYSKKEKQRKKSGLLPPSQNPWKILYIGLCLVLIALTAFQFFVIFREPTYGEDYRVFEGAVLAFDHMQNPYVLDNINQYVGHYTGEVLPFTYPPHTLYFFVILDQFLVFQNIGIYYVLLILLLILSGYLIVTLDQDPDYLFLITLIVAGFMGTAWNLVTGNKDILFLFLFALTFVLLLKERFWESAIITGLAAAVSLITAPFAALYLIVKRPLPHRFAYICIAGGVVAALFVVSYCINPAYLGSYISTLQGTSSPLYDQGGTDTPTPFLLFGDLLKEININGILPVAIVACIYAGLILYATGIFFTSNEKNTLKMYSIVFLAIFMMLPRIKPYDFIITVIPLYFLCKDYSYRMKCLMLGVISLPIFFWFLNFFSVYTQGFPLKLGGYIQAYSLILVFILIILYDRWLPVTHNGEGTAS